MHSHILPLVSTPKFNPIRRPITCLYCRLPSLPCLLQTPPRTSQAGAPPSTLLHVTLLLNKVTSTTSRSPAVSYKLSSGVVANVSPPHTKVCHLGNCVLQAKVEASHLTLEYPSRESTCTRLTFKRISDCSSGFLFGKAQNSREHLWAAVSRFVFERTLGGNSLIARTTRLN